MAVGELFRPLTAPVYACYCLSALLAISTFIRGKPRDGVEGTYDSLITLIPKELNGE